MTCSNPIDAAILADYWLGALPDAEEEPAELHLLSCDACGRRLHEIIALAEGIRQLARSGSLRMIVSDTFLHHSAQAGLRVRSYSPPAGGSVQCTVGAEDDLLIGHLAADLAGVQRLDASICDGNGVEQLRLADIPIPASADGLNFQESITFAKDLPSTTMIMRLLSLDAAGAERLIGEYTFHHTRTLPGPGAF